MIPALDQARQRARELVRRLTDVGTGVLHQARWREKDFRIFDLELDARMAEVREALWIAKGRQRRHDLVNAFMAVEGASIILGRESLTASDRARLLSVLESGMTRLRAMIVTEAGTTEETVSLAAVTASLAEEPAWQGRLEIAVGPDLVAAGLPFETTEAARQLLWYCRGRAPATPLTLRGVSDGGQVVLWVEDRGPAVAERLRRSLLGPGPVTGLHIAVRLVTPQGGTVVLQVRPEGGMSFGISLPVAPRPGPE